MQSGVRIPASPVGGAQKLVPAHVANEYCRCDCSFVPTPDFRARSTLQRYLKDFSDIPWFSTGLGTNFAFFRAGNRWGSGATADNRHSRYDSPVDISAMEALMRVRLEEYNALKLDLLQQVRHQGNRI